MTRGLRAISPVVATTLLIIIAVITAVVLYLWVSGTVSQQPTEQAKLQESIKIDEVNITNGRVYDIYVRNVGSLATSIDSVYIIDVETGNTIYAMNTTSYFFNVTDTAGNIINTISPGSIAVIHLYDNTTGTPVAGLDVSNFSAIVIKVVTKNGIEATYVAMVRS